MINRLLIIAYKGCYFSGSQIQKDVLTAQALIESSLSKIFNAKTKVHPCSRLDQGVSASFWGVSFLSEKIADNDKLKYALNHFLPSYMHINQIINVGKDFDARYQAKMKTYLYTINTGEPDPLHDDLVWIPPFKFNIEKYQEAIQLFEGEHDFSSFFSPDKEHEESSFKKIEKIICTQEEKYLLTRIIGHSFGRYQVRYIVGAAYGYAAGRISIEEIQDRLSSKSHGLINIKVPANALVLECVDFDFSGNQNAHS
jgi:tRNA pseudouridine38-40 synthase